MMSKFQIQIIAHKPDDATPWVRIIFDECHLWAIFGDNPDEVNNPDAEPMNITTSPEFLQGYIIKQINVYEV
jgi:hypothetical protein